MSKKNKKMNTCVTANRKTYNSISSYTVSDINSKTKGGCRGRLVLCHRLYKKFSEQPRYPRYHHLLQLHQQFYGVKEAIAHTLKILWIVKVGKAGFRLASSIYIYIYLHIYIYFLPPGFLPVLPPPPPLLSFYKFDARTKDI